MTRQLAKLLVLLLLVVGGAIGLWQYELRYSEGARREAEIRSLKEQAQQLEKFVERLTTEKRRAEIVVTDQATAGESIESTSLLFVEYAPDGNRLPPRFFTIKGKVVHVDALVIKFEQDLVKTGDPLRGHSLALFYRIFGDFQAPVDGFRIDQPGQVPEVYKGGPRQSQAAHAFEMDLWKNFWQLTEDAKYRHEKGIRVAMGETVWRHVYPNYVYSVTLESSGGLNITERPMDELWKTYSDTVRKNRLTKAE